MSDNTVSVNDISSSIWYSLIISIFTKASISFWNMFVNIWNQWNVHWSESSLFSWFHWIFHMREFGINWASNNFTTKFFELLSFVAEGDDLSWADKSEVEWIEEENNIFSFIVRDADINKIVIKPSRSFELRSRFSDEWHIFKEKL